MEINGFSDDHRENYLRALTPMAESYGWKVLRMSDCTQESPGDFHTKVRENVEKFPIYTSFQDKLFSSAQRRAM